MKNIFLSLVTFVVLLSCTNKIENSISNQNSNEITEVKKDMGLNFSYKAPDFYEIVPGKSLGDVNIGESRGSLTSRGFVEGKEYLESEKYMVRDFVHVLLEGEVVSQIWLTEYYTDKLRFNGKKIPKKLVEIKKMFSNCGEIITGSGGTYFSCENNGVRFTSRYPSEDYIYVTVTKSN